jgi:hypothetical protein
LTNIKLINVRFEQAIISSGSFFVKTSSDDWVMRDAVLGTDVGGGLEMV